MGMPKRLDYTDIFNHLYCQIGSVSQFQKFRVQLVHWILLPVVWNRAGAKSMWKWHSALKWSQRGNCKTVLEVNTGNLIFLRKKDRFYLLWGFVFTFIRSMDTEMWFELPGLTYSSLSCINVAWLSTDHPRDQASSAVSFPAATVVVLSLRAFQPTLVCFY